MKLILRYIFRHKSYLLLTLFGVIGFVLIQLGIPTVLKYIINDSIIPKNYSLLVPLALVMLGISVVGVLGEICMAFANSRIASSVIHDIRNDIFTKTQSFSHNEFNQFSVSSLITSTTSDAYQIMLFVQNMLRIALITPVMAISGFVLIMQSNPSMTVIVLIAISVILLGVFFISRVSRIQSKIQQTTLDRINLILREGISGLRVIRAFDNQEFQSQRFGEVNEAYSNVSKKVFRMMSVVQPGFYLIFNTMIALILWIGSLAIGKGTLDVGTLNASIEYIFHILFSFLMLAVLLIMYPRAAVSAQRIEAILNSPLSIDENLGSTVAAKKLTGVVEFKNVSFSYADDTESQVLKNITFTASPGQTVAFIGSTGSGKSTLVQLLPRMYDVTEGCILVDGIDIRDYNIHTLRQKIAFIPQKAQLFTGTIAENLRIGKHDATLDELKTAAEIAQASDFINEKENGYDEILSEGGSNLSGGQKQRLSIARAIVKKSNIYVFDDSFSALDYTTDLKLRTRLKEELKNATFLIVAQRIGTIRHADKIIVLNEGEIVAQGTHQELLKTSGIYYDIAISQLSEEELT